MVIDGTLMNMVIDHICGITCNGMNIEEQFELGDLLLEERRCRVCGGVKNLIDGFYKTHKNRLSLPSSYAYECKACTIKRIVDSRKNKKSSNEWIYPDW